MATPQLSPAAIFSQLEAGRIAISAGYAAFALVIFDFFLSLSEEANRMWRPRKTLVFALFVTLRYATIFYQMTFSMSFFLPIQSNKGSVPFVSPAGNGLIGVPQMRIHYICGTSVFTLRTFAIYKRNYFILAILVVVASVKVFISAVDFFVSAKVAAQAPAFRQFGSCNEILPPDAKRWNTSSASLALAFDTIVLALTLAKTVRTSLRTRQLGMKNSYSYYILRDGILYYLAIEILLLFTVIFNQVPSLVIRVARVVIILQTSLAPILGQRLVLNLRSVEETIVNSTETNSQPLPAIDFAHGSVIGNIGAPLRMTEDGASEDFDFDSDEMDVSRTINHDGEETDGIQIVDRIHGEKRFHQDSNTTVDLAA